MVTARSFTDKTRTVKAESFVLSVFEDQNVTTTAKFASVPQINNSEWTTQVIIMFVMKMDDGEWTTYDCPQRSITNIKIEELFMFD